MSRRVRGGLVVAGLLCALALAACGRNGGSGSGSARVPADLDSLAFHPESTQVRADIDSGNAQYIQAWKLGSADLFAKIFAIDGELTRRDGTRLHGRDTITAYMGNVFTQWRMRHGTITTRELRVDGDRAYESGTYLFEMVPVKGGAARVDSGQFAQVWKYNEGQWRMWRNDLKPRG